MPILLLDSRHNQVQYLFCITANFISLFSTTQQALLMVSNFLSLLLRPLLPTILLFNRRLNLVHRLIRITVKPLLVQHPFCITASFIRLGGKPILLMDSNLLLPLLSILLSNLLVQH